MDQHDRADHGCPAGVLLGCDLRTATGGHQLLADDQMDAPAESVRAVQLQDRAGSHAGEELRADLGDRAEHSASQRNRANRDGYRVRFGRIPESLL